ncbi:hypothetical protein AZ037_005694, partial [Klebsiella michiganensis]
MVSLRIILIFTPRENLQKSYSSFVLYSYSYSLHCNTKNHTVLGATKFIKIFHLLSCRVESLIL